MEAKWIGGGESYAASASFLYKNNDILKFQLRMLVKRNNSTPHRLLLTDALKIPNSLPEYCTRIFTGKSLFRRYVAPEKRMRNNSVMQLLNDLVILQ